MFDGSSFVIHPDGERVVQMCDWDEALLITDWERDARRLALRDALRRMSSMRFPADVYRAMMVGLRDYVQRNGFPGVILGLSGGIDSALSAAVAVDALGAGQGVGRDAARPNIPARKASRTRASARGCSAAAMTSFRSRPAVDAVDEMLPEHERACRRERPGAPADGGADGAVQRAAGRCC